MYYEDQFDFGRNPSVIIDAWFKTTNWPALLICVVLFSLCAFSQ
jgi:hypothetical protein